MTTAMKRGVAWRVTVMVAGLGFGMGLAGCRKAPGTGGAAYVPPPASYFEIYSVSPLRDAAHAVAFVDGQGKQWFRESTPAFNLSDFEAKQATRSTGPDGSAYVDLQTKESQRDRLALWSVPQVGKDVALFLNGSPHFICQPTAPLAFAVGIRCDTAVQAQQILDVFTGKARPGPIATSQPSTAPAGG